MEYRVQGEICPKTCWSALSLALTWKPSPPCSWYGLLSYTSDNHIMRNHPIVESLLRFYDDCQMTDDLYWQWLMTMTLWDNWCRITLEGPQPIAQRYRMSTIMIFYIACHCQCFTSYLQCTIVYSGTAIVQVQLLLVRYRRCSQPCTQS